MRAIGVSYQQFVIFDDAEQFGPLAKALLPQQECADPRILHQIHGRFFRGPLVTHLLVLPIFLLLIVRLVGAAHGIRVVVWKFVQFQHEISSKFTHSFQLHRSYQCRVKQCVAHLRWCIQEPFRDLTEPLLRNNLLVERSWAEEEGRCWKAVEKTNSLMSENTSKLQHPKINSHSILSWIRLVGAPKQIVGLDTNVLYHSSVK